MAGKHSPDMYGRFFVVLFSCVAFGLSAYIISNIYRDADLTFFVSASGILLLYSGLVPFFENTSKSSFFLLDLIVLLLAFAASVDITYYIRVWGWSCTKQGPTFYPAESSYIICSVVFGYLASLTQAAVLIFLYKPAASPVADPKPTVFV